MKREDVDGLLADILAEHFARLRADLEGHIERQVAQRALPPFTPPGAWSAGRHGAGSVVRHRNGVFSARRDTEGEPGDDEAWLPILVGIASLVYEGSDERSLVRRATLSDGAVVETRRALTLPIVRGYWEADTVYKTGDRVIRMGEWHAVRESRGVDPSTDSGAHWIKVSGKQARGLAFTLDDEGTLFESGRAAGSLKPLIETLLAKHLGGAP